MIGVEPLAAMRAVLEREVPAAETLDGGAGSIPLADAAVGPGRRPRVRGLDV